MTKLATAPKNHGYARRRQCLDPNNAKVCGHCDRWFNPRPRESVCDACVPKKSLVQRLAKHPTPIGTTKPAKGRSRDAGQGTKSDYLGLTFKPEVPLWYVLAMEEAARLEDQPPRPVAGMRACEPDCACEPCAASRPPEYRRQG